MNLIGYNLSLSFLSFSTPRSLPRSLATSFLLSPSGPAVPQTVFIPVCTLGARNPRHLRGHRDDPEDTLFHGQTPFRARKDPPVPSTVLAKLPGRSGRCLPCPGAQSFPPRGQRVCSCPPHRKTTCADELSDWACALQKWKKLIRRLLHEE